MTAFRARFLKERTGISDPHAAWFVSRNIQRYAGTAYLRDRRTIGRSFARFMRFGERMESAASRVPQFLFLGVGYDTRALWLPAFATGDVRIFEIDLPHRIERKVAILAENGVTYPQHVTPIGIDLGSPDLLSTLQASGFDAARPAGVFLEGVVFNLPTELAGRMLEPAYLALAGGSEMTFDYWSNTRIDQRNAELASPGFPTLGHFPLPDQPETLRTALVELGYRDVEVTPLADLANRLWPDEGHADSGWFIVEATVR